MSNKILLIHLIFIWLITANLLNLFGQTPIVITEDTIWSGEVSMEQDVTIDAGTKLTISPGTIIKVFDYDGDNDGIGDVSLEIKGTLIADGTLEDPIIFRSLEPVKYSTAEWYGIIYNPQENDTLVLNHVQIHNVYFGINIKPFSLNVSDDNPVHLVLNNVIINKSAEAGIFIDYDDDHENKDVCLSSNNLRIYNSSKDGIGVNDEYSKNVTLTLYDCSIKSGERWALYGGNSHVKGDIRHSSFSFFKSGIYLGTSDCDVTFDSCYIANHQQAGLLVFRGKPIITNSTITKNKDYGIGYNNKYMPYCAPAPAGTVKKCNIEHNPGFGVMVNGNMVPILNNCNIKNNATDLEMRYRSFPSIDVGIAKNAEQSIYLPYYYNVDSIKLYQPVLTYSYFYSLDPYIGLRDFVRIYFNGWFSTKPELVINGIEWYTNQTKTSDTLKANITEIFSSIKPNQQLVTCNSNSDSPIDARNNFWGQSDNIGELISQGVDSTVNYDGFERNPIEPCGVVTTLWPDIYSIPENQSFYAVPGSSSSKKSLIIYNPGAERRDFNIKLNADNNNFTVDSLFSSIDPAMSKTLWVTFESDTIGLATATLEIQSDQEILYIPLSGKVIAPKIDIEPISLDFDSVWVDFFKELAISVFNTGNANLFVNPPWFLDESDSSFSIAAGNSGFTVVPGDTTQNIKIRFLPSRSGSYSNSLYIESNDPVDSIKTVNLKGIGGAPDIKVEPDTLDFGNMILRDEAIIDTLKIINTGNFPLVVDSTLLSTKEFLLNSGWAPFTLLSDDTQLVEIVFHPITRGAKEDNLVIVSNAPNMNRIKIPLSGKCLAPRINVNPGQLDFGNVSLYEEKTRNISVSNVGDVALIVSTPQIAGGSTSPFSLIMGEQGFTIPPNDTARTISIEFVPKFPNNFSDTLYIRANDPEDSLMHVLLTGTGVASNIKVEPMPMIFGKVIPGNMLLDTLKITNIGKDILTVDSTLLFSNDFAITRGQAPFTLSDGVSHNIEICFQPNKKGEKQDTLRIISDAFQFEYLNIPLIGKAVADSTLPEFNLISDFDSLEAGKNFTFQIEITDNDVAISSAQLFVREGGDTTFTTGMELNNIVDNLYSTLINEDQVTTRGLEYFVEVSHGDTLSYFPSEGKIKPAAVSVKISKLEFPTKTQQNLYQMTSIPANTNNQTLRQLFQDNLGVYDNTKYRIFDYDQATGKHIEQSSLTSTLPPGKALWLITKEPKTLDINNASSILTNEPFSIELLKGWNMIAVPYNFTVAWNSVDTSGINKVKGKTLYYYDGRQWLFSDNWEPYRGYAVEAIAKTTLTIPPIASSGLTKKQTAFWETRNDEWFIQIKAERGEYKDNFNFAGIKNGASADWDITDIGEPPQIGNYISVFFDHRDWETWAGRYAGDFRNPTSDGYNYDFAIVSNFDGQTKINFELHNLPDNIHWAIISPVSRVKYPQGKIITPLRNASYRLVIGSISYFENETINFRDIPRQFKLSQNYPNPFNPDTKIIFELPIDNTISVEIYNVIGQKVRTLKKNEDTPSGYYTVNWDARNDSNTQVPSGIYLLRLSSNNFVKSIKMLLIR